MTTASAYGATAQCAEEFEALNARLLMLLDTGKYDEAVAIAERALAQAEQAFGPSHPKTVTALANVRHRYQAVGRFAEAESAFRRVLAICEAAPERDHPDMTVELSSLASLNEELGR